MTAAPGTPTARDRRVLGRETHSSRSGLAITVASLIIVVCLVVATERVLEFLGRAPLLFSLTDAARTASAPAADLLRVVVPLGIGVALVGLFLLLAAILPARRTRHGLSTDRLAVVIDDEVIASALARTTAAAAEHPSAPRRRPDGPSRLVTSTNRTLNRILLAFSAVLLLLGSGAAIVASVPAVLHMWRQGAAIAIAEIETLLSATPVAGGVSWAPLASLALVAVLVWVLLIFVARQVRGRTETLVNTPLTSQGRTRIDAAFAEEALEQSLAGQSDLLGLYTSTYRANGASMLRVAVLARRGTAQHRVTSSIPFTNPFEGSTGCSAMKAPCFYTSAAASAVVSQGRPN